MILETVTCLILRCSRCNKAFRDDVDDDYSGVAHWGSREDIAKSFSNGFSEYGGWRRFGDRYVCSRCQISNGYGDDMNAREVSEPLPGVEADKVARAQAGYAKPDPQTVALDRLVGAAEDVLAEAEQAETDAVVSGVADPARLGAPALKALREAINAIPSGPVSL